MSTLLTPPEIVKAGYDQVFAGIDINPGSPTSGGSSFTPSAIMSCAVSVWSGSIPVTPDGVDPTAGGFVPPALFRPRIIRHIRGKGW